MNPITDVPSPGGWLKTYGVRVAKGLAIGTVAVAATMLFYGKQNGGQVEHYCEGPLVTQTGAKIVALSCRNPFQGTGAILSTDDQGLFILESPYIGGTVDAGISTTSTTSGQTVFNNVQLTGARRFIPLSVSGATAFRASRLIRVASGSYLNFTFSTTSGATTSGKYPAFIRVKWFNCSDVSDDINC